MNDQFAERTLIDFHEQIAALSRSGSVVAYLFANASEWKWVSGYRRDHWSHRKRPVYGEPQSVGEFEVRWIEPAPEGSRYMVGSATPRASETQEAATEAFVAELNSDTFTALEGPYELHWLHGAERKRILDRFFEFSTIREFQTQ